MEIEISGKDFKTLATSFNIGSAVNLEVSKNKLIATSEGKKLTFEVKSAGSAKISVQANDLALVPKTRAQKIWLTLVFGTFDKYIHICNPQGYLAEVNLVKLD